MCGKVGGSDDLAYDIIDEGPWIKELEVKHGPTTKKSKREVGLVKLPGLGPRSADKQSQENHQSNQ
jgi:hypothetical protein